MRRPKWLNTVPLHGPGGPPDPPLNPAPPNFVAFPVGARVLVDGRDEARIRACWPHGSSALLAPHYSLAFIDGDENVRVHYSRVGVERKSTT